MYLSRKENQDLPQQCNTVTIFLLANVTECLSPASFCENIPQQHHHYNHHKLSE